MPAMAAGASSGSLLRRKPGIAAEPEIQQVLAIGVADAGLWIKLFPPLYRIDSLDRRL